MPLDGVHLLAPRAPLPGAATNRVTVPAGLTLAEMVATALPEFPADLARRHAHVSIGSHPVPADLWARVRPKAGTEIRVIVVPDGNDGLRMALFIALAVAVAVAVPIGAPLLAGAFAPTVLAGGVGVFGSAAAAAAATAVAGTVIAAGLTIAGGLLINSLVPPAQEDTGGSIQPKPLYSVTGSRNRARLYDYSAAVLGRMRRAGDLFASPYTETIGDNQYVTIPIEWGIGPLQISDIRIGGVAIDDFDSVVYETREGYADDKPLTLYPGIYWPAAPGIELREENSWYEFETPKDVDRLSFELTFSGGLVGVTNGGRQTDRSVSFVSEYRAVGAGSWNNGPGIDLEKEEPNPFRAGNEIWFPARGQYEFRIRRVTADDAPRTSDKAFITSIQCFRNESPLRTEEPRAVTVVRIKASEVATGTLDQITAVCQAVLPDWDYETEEWVERVTRNPASAFRAVWQGAASRRPQADSRTDLAAIEDWHDFCRLKGLTYDYVHGDGGGQDDVLAVLTQIAAAGRARPVTGPDGKLSVIIDRDTDVVARVIPETDAGNFQWTRTLPANRPHAWRVIFSDSSDGSYEQRERIIPRRDLIEAAGISDPSGYSDSGLLSAMALAGYPVTLLEQLPLPGLTDPAQIWREGQRRFAESFYRLNTYSLDMDALRLLLRPGERVTVAEQLFDWGLGSGRVPPGGVLSGGRIRLDQPVTMEEGETYKVRFSDATGSWLRDVVTAAGTTRLVTLSGSGEVPAEDDAWMLGKASEIETHDLIVRGVTAADELSGTLSLVDYDERIELWADDPEFGPPTWDGTAAPSLSQAGQPPAVPRITSVASGTYQQVVDDDGTVTQYVRVGVSAGLGGVVPTEWVDIQWRYAATGAPDTSWHDVRRIALLAGSVFFAGPVAEDEIAVRAQAITLAGRASPWSAETAHTVGARDFAPPAPATLNISKGPGVWRLVWGAVTGVPEIAGYRIKAAVGYDQDWGDMVPIHNGILTTSPWESTLPDYYGEFTFGICSVSRSGIESDEPLLKNAWLAAPAGADGSDDPDVRLDRYERALGWPGTKSFLAVLATGDLNSTAGFDDALAYTTPTDASDIDLGEAVTGTLTITLVGSGNVSNVVIEYATDSSPIGSPSWNTYSGPAGIAAQRYLRVRLSAGDSGHSQTITIQSLRIYVRRG